MKETIKQSGLYKMIKAYEIGKRLLNNDTHIDVQKKLGLRPKRSQREQK
jgi:hypothetical protein